MRRPSRINLLRRVAKFKSLCAWLVFILGMGLFRTAIADWNYVPSGSMEPTLFAGDLLWVDKTAYGPSVPFTHSRLFETGEPKRGDIITFYPPHENKQLVKRVIGLPGDKLKISGQMVWVNDVKLSVDVDLVEEAFVGFEEIGSLSHKIRLETPYQAQGRAHEFTVPQRHYFVLGDNRDNSLDSRYWGFVDADHIMGRVTHIALSISSKRSGSERIANKID